MKIFALPALLILALNANMTASDAGELVGRASVIDGDTIEIHGERIRFNGVDAPESSQLCKNALGNSYRCGADASKALDEFLAASRPTRCEFVEFDRYDRFVGICFRADGTDVNEWLVENGHALDWARYSNARYAAAQEHARINKNGMWAGRFDLPWEWRRGVRDVSSSVPAAATIPPDDKCVIKGNINSKGDKIYHRPGQRHYEQVTIHEHRGQRWFCSEAEAEAAGWRASLR